MKNVRKILIALGVTVLAFCGLATVVSADGANVTYDGDAGRFVFAPGSAESPTDLFAGFKDVMPGASLTQRITVTNQADSLKKVKLYLRALGGTDPETAAFLNQLTLTVTKTVDSPLFETAEGQTFGVTDWVCLGTLSPGASLDLDVTLGVPASLDNSFANRAGEIRWQFSAEPLSLTLPAWNCPTDKTHAYRVEERDGIAVFMCEECGNSEPMKCAVCGGEMRRMSADGEDAGAGQTEYTFYECRNDPNHRTDPQAEPENGKPDQLGFWIAVLAIGCLLEVFLLFCRGRKTAGK